MKRYNNHHKHDHISNIFTPDTNAHFIDYVNRAIELGEPNVWTTNHGSGGDIFEAKQLADANGWYRNLVKIASGTTIIPTGLFIFIAAAVICAIILNKTKAGRYILCLGSNKEAVRLSGVDVRKWEALAYILCGMLAGCAAIFYVGAYTTVQPGLGDTFNNEAIASCVMGGTSMSGGIASIGGTFIGVVIISILQEGILAMGFQKDYQYVITGIIVLVAVWADIRSRARRN